MLRATRIGARRTLIFGVLAGLFALAVVVTAGEPTSRCEAVTSEQRALLESLIDTGAHTFRATGPATCVDGLLSATVVGIADEMTAATAQLAADGWDQQTEYIGYHRQTWQRCFRLDRAGWEHIQLLVDADRGGTVRDVVVAAPERGEACDLERRDRSDIYPPRSRNSPSSTSTAERSAAGSGVSGR